MMDGERLASDLWLKGINVIPLKRPVTGERQVIVEFFWNRKFEEDEQVTVKLNVMVRDEMDLSPVTISNPSQTITARSRDATFNLGNSGTIVVVGVDATKGTQHLGYKTDSANL